MGAKVVDILMCDKVSRKGRKGISQRAAKRNKQAKCDAWY